LVTPKAKEKIFRLTPQEESVVNDLIQYAYKTGAIEKPTFQDFMRFAIHKSHSALKEDWDAKKETHHRRAIV